MHFNKKFHIQEAAQCASIFDSVGVDFYHQIVWLIITWNNLITTWQIWVNFLSIIKRHQKTNQNVIHSFGLVGSKASLVGSIDLSLLCEQMLRLGKLCIHWWSRTKYSSIVFCQSTFHTIKFLRHHQGWLEAYHFVCRIVLQQKLSNILFKTIMGSSISRFCWETFYIKI